MSWVLSPAIPGNDWDAIDWTARPPTDQTFRVSDENIFADASAIYAVVQDRADGKLWNGSALVTPSPSSWALYAIPGEQYATRAFAVTVPFSTMPERQYLVRLFNRRGATPEGSDRVLRTVKVNSFTNGAPNPAGIVVDSDFGQVNAMRVIDPTGRPLEGVEVKATVTFPDGVADRGEAKTDREGRWTLNLVCEPHRPHTITFTFPGFEAASVNVTPGRPA